MDILLDKMQPAFPQVILKKKIQEQRLLQFKLQIISKQSRQVQMVNGTQINQRIFNSNFQYKINLQRIKFSIQKVSQRHMQDDQVWVGTLERSDSQDILKVIVAANKEINPKIIKGGQTVEEFEMETRDMIKDYFDTQEQENKETGRDVKNFFGAKINGKLAAAVMAIDAVHRYRVCKKIAEDKTHPGQGFYLAISKMKFEDLKLGKISYHARMSVYPGLRKNGISRLVHCFMCKYQHEHGYESMVSTTFYDLPTNSLMRYGSYVVLEISYDVRNIRFDEKVLMTSLKTAADICETKFQELYAKL